MYRIVAMNPNGSETTIYDPVGAGALPVLSPRSTEELNEAGSLEFALVYGHEAWEQLEPKKTYIRAELDGHEFFYGRVLNAEPSRLTGQIQYLCAGALSFLQDSEVPPDAKKSDGSSNFQTMTAEAFFRRCIDAHNADIGNDPRRTFTVGIVNHSRKNEQREYQLSTYNNTKSVITQNLIGYYGGFLRTRRENGVLYIDWVEQYGDTDQGVLELGRNIISLMNRMAGEDLYTAIRPVGKDGLTLSGSQTIDIFPAAEMAEYGRIVRNVQFQDAETEESLRSKAEDLVNKIHKTLVISSEISLLDMIFTDEDSHGVNLGDTYNHISGLDGIAMTVAARNRDFENPQNDTCSLKNPKCFEGDANGESKSSGSISKRASGNSAGLGYSYKYIHEFQDRLELNTKEIYINAEQLELHADMFVETANEFARISHVEGTMRDELNQIEGTGVFQNSEHITSVAGRFRTITDPQTGIITEIQLLEGSTFSVEKDGVYSEVVNENGMSSAIEQTASMIRTEVANTASGIYSQIEQTPELVRTEVATAVSGIAHSVIEQTATYIHTEVTNAASSISASVIEQTAEYVRTEVASVASGIAWSVVEQTMTGIFQEVARKSKVYRQWTDPNDGINVLNDGDVWIKVNEQRTWNELATLKWNQIAQKQWKDFYGLKTFVWKGTSENGHWDLVRDEAKTTESRTWIEQNDERYAILARQIDTQGNAYESNLSVTAQKISSEVSTAKGELYSSIAQTATNINLHVEDVRNGLQSNIEQTAESITTSVSAAKSALYSTIQQTATQIRSEVANAVSGLRSSITQTATQIRTEVANTVSGLRSSITLNANKIALVVDSGNNIKAAQIVASINDGASSVIISADHINLDGYVKSSQLTTDWLNGKIAQISTLTGIAARFSGNVAGSGGLFDAVYVKKSTNNYANISDPILEVQISGPTNNVYKLQYKSVTNTVWTDAGSFSRAISTWTWGGGSGYINVTALPQSQTKSIKVSIDGTSSITANGTYTYNVDYENGDGDDVPTGASKTVTVNVPTTSRTDKGSNWSCSVTQLSSGGKKCTLTKEFAAGASVPFSNGSSYHLYT